MRWNIYNVAWLGLLHCIVPACYAEDFLPATYGALPDDGIDDTVGIHETLDAAAAAGGGRVLFTNGTFIVKRQSVESPILKIRSNITVEGQGTNTILKFHDGVLTNNFWRMIGADVAEGHVSNINILNLKMDGRFGSPSYYSGSPEQNHGLFFYASGTNQSISNVLISNIVTTGFSGDSILVSYGCKGFIIDKMIVGDFGRQGVSLAGGNGANNYIVRNCIGIDTYTGWVPGGHTIHVEDGRGVSNILIVSNYCPQGMAVGSASDVTVRSNIIRHHLVGHSSTNILTEFNTITGDGLYAISHGYCTNIVVQSNTISNPYGMGVYLWGKTAYNTNMTRSVRLVGNSITTDSAAVQLNGVYYGIISNNSITTTAGPAVVVKRSELIQYNGLTGESGSASAAIVGTITVQ